MKTQDLIAHFKILNRGVPTIGSYLKEHTILVILNKRGVVDHSDLTKWELDADGDFVPTFWLQGKHMQNE